MKFYQPEQCYNVAMYILVLLLGLGLVLTFQMSVLAQDVKTLAKEADKAIRNSQRAMFNSKFEEAQKELEKAADLIEQIKAADPDFAQLKTLQSKYEKQKKDLEKRLPKETPAKPDSGTQPEQSTTQADKLPGGVTSRLKNIDRTLERGNQVLTKDVSDDWKMKAGEDILNQVNGLMEEIINRYGDQFKPDHPEVKARQDGIAELQNKLEQFKAGVAERQGQAAQAEAQQEALSKEWLDKIKPYVTGLGKPGYDENKHLGSGTDNVDELVQQKAIYTEAKALFDEYQQVEFPHGKTQELELAEKDFVRALKGFEKGYQETLERFATRISEPLDRAEQWLTEQEAKAQSEGEKKPVYLHRNVIQEITNGIFALEAATAGEDSRLQAFNERLANIEKRAEKLRQLGVERTVMIPDKFKGQEIDTLKTKAAEFLHKEYSDANVLRTTIISDDWTEERVWEYTDTTKTAVRYRITQSVTAQIAGKRGNEVFLYTIHIAKNQRSDGSWGELYGHVMFIDPMLEENVNK
jgi:hypothetical protein